VSWPRKNCGHLNQFNGNFGLMQKKYPYREAVNKINFSTGEYRHLRLDGRLKAL
jgi:hypothetical protein